MYELLNSGQADIVTKEQGQISLHIPTRNFVKWRGIFSVLLSFDKIFAAVICVKSSKKWMTTAMIEMNLKENPEIKVRKNEGTSLMC